MVKNLFIQVQKKITYNLFFTFFDIQGKMIPQINIELIGALNIESIYTFRSKATFPSLLTANESRKIKKKTIRAKKMVLFVKI